MENARQCKHFWTKVKSFFSCRDRCCKRFFARRKANKAGDENEAGQDLENRPVLSPRDGATALDAKNRRG